ncbi:PucR family transcriptional regulator [Brevibacillus reuszeri]|uniref:PucR family transcriptional regulator n=1 Tax=Brevibacillus reuszeri TaxID=54915 RepID=UPI00289A4C21|nr:helix-turn-helix domain-containing protein [Brevibacillus reuszeri]
MENWIKDVEKIHQATGLPITCLQTEANKVEELQQTHKERGWELVTSAQDTDGIWLVLIESSEWHPAARAMLGLFFTQPLQKTSIPEQLGSWLQGIAVGNHRPFPARLEQQWPWREERVCFLLERCRVDSTFEWTALQPVLHDFFKSNEQSSPSLIFVPLNHSYLFLIVPLSMLANQSEKEELLEWASGLHDLITTEYMENIRILAGLPLSAPTVLDKELMQLLSLSHAIAHFRPRTMVAGSWLHLLERWASSLPSQAATAISNQIRSLASIPQLNAEQVETLETLFSRQLNVSDTARQLFLHRNTLLYRLDKLTEQTGLDPRMFSDAVLLQLYLLFRQN